MKNLMLITVLLVAFSMQSCAQKSDNKNVPEKVLSAFNAKFPDAKKVEWEMENDSEWEAEFKWNAKEYSANFSADGKWRETEYEIKESEIPSNIRAILDQNFSDYEIEEPVVAETPSGRSYEMEIEEGEEEYEVTIGSKGNLTKKKESEEKDENDED
ncbi:MAG: PepSY-like domain-containing protein [Bacteroidota bacterium]